MILAIIQARMSSTRLPGKVLRPILGRPMLLHQIERVRRSKLIDSICVATSDDPSDDQLVSTLAKDGVAYFRGALNDVLDRFYRAAIGKAPEHVVRLTGDCPLADPAVIDDLIRLHLSGGFDYSSNCLKYTFPDGLDAEIMAFAALEHAWKNARLPSEREHVTPYIFKRPELFHLGSLELSHDYSTLRVTVDEAADFKLVTKVFEALYPANPAFGMQDIVVYLDQNPDVKKLNASIKPNEGYLKSLEKDLKVNRT